MYIFKEIKLPSRGLLSSSLSKIYGLGFYKSFALMSKLGFSRLAKAKVLNLYKFNTLAFYIKKFFLTESTLKKIIYVNIQDKINLNTYSGFRHMSNLPVRGQRTHTNASSSRTRKILKIKT